MSYVMLPVAAVSMAIAIVLFLSIVWAAVSAAVQRQRRISQVKRELYSLNDRDLRDIGICRCDISRIAKS